MKSQGNIILQKDHNSSTTKYKYTKIGRNDR